MGHKGAPGARDAGGQGVVRNGHAPFAFLSWTGAEIYQLRVLLSRRSPSPPPPRPLLAPCPAADARGEDGDRTGPEGKRRLGDLPRKEFNEKELARRMKEHERTKLELRCHCFGRVDSTVRLRHTKWLQTASLCVQPTLLLSRYVATAVAGRDSLARPARLQVWHMPAPSEYGDEGDEGNAEGHNACNARNLGAGERGMEGATGG